MKKIMVPLPNMEKKDLIQLVLAAVAENERLLRACHAQRDRARRAEAEFNRATPFLMVHGWFSSAVKGGPNEKSR